MTRTLRHSLRSPRARLIVAAALAYALLAPVYGPALSPTFVELLPHHGHVHAGAYGQAHLHSYEAGGDAPSAYAIPPDGDGASAAGVAAAAALAALAVLAAAPVTVRVASRRPALPAGVALGTDTPPPRTAPLFA